MVICWVIVYILKESIFVILSLKKLFKNSSKTLRKSLRQSSSTKVLRPSCEDLWLISKSSFMGLSTLVRYLGGGGRRWILGRKFNVILIANFGTSRLGKRNLFLNSRFIKISFFVLRKMCDISFFPLQWLKQKLILKTSKVS